MAGFVRWTSQILFAVLILVTAGNAPAAATDEFVESEVGVDELSARWHMVVEPRFMRPDFAIPIAGSERTVLTPAIIVGDTVTYLKRDSFDSLGVDLESIRRLGRIAASEELAKLEPRYLRDPAGVVQAAIIDSDRPVVASTVLAPDFIERFRDTLGPDLLVAIPNRYRVYIFPALASRFAETAGAVLGDYDLTPYPVSREIFRVRPDGTLQAIGTFEE